MKYCPTCEARYDEDILRFCMKDGTPLLDEAEPNFIEMPSESLAAAEQVDLDDPSEHTVIRRNVPSQPTAATPKEPTPAPPPPQEPIEDFSDLRRHEPAPPSGGQRIVVPTFEEQQRQERARVAAQYQNLQPRGGSNTIAVVALTMFGTVFVLAIFGAILYLLMADRGGTAANANTNLNANQNVDLNTNQFSNGLFDPNNTSSNVNTVSNTNSNANANANANLKTPTPTPKPSVTPSPIPDDDDDDPTPTPTVNITPSTPRPATPTPRPVGTPIPVPTPRTIMTPANRPNN